MMMEWIINRVVSYDTDTALSWMQLMALLRIPFGIHNCKQHYKQHYKQSYLAYDSKSVQQLSTWCKMRNNLESVRPQLLPPNQAIHPNEVVVETGIRKKTYYLPCYLRFLLKEINRISAADKQAELSGTLVVSFSHTGVPLHLVNHFTDRSENAPAIILEFNKEDSVLLKEGKDITMKRMKNDQGIYHMVQYTIRQKFKVKLAGNVFLTPFQKLFMDLNLTMHSVSLSLNETQYAFRFNCMQHINSDHPFHLIRHAKSITFGHYRVISCEMTAKFSQSREGAEEGGCSCIKEDDYEESEEEREPLRRKDQEGLKIQDPQEKKRQDGLASQKKKDLQPVNSYNLDQQLQKIKPFQYAHFRIPIYKYPGSAILTIFVPFYILGAIGLLVFFQEPSLSGRLATIAVLILAFVAFIPTINGQIPQRPRVKLVEILIGLHLLALILLGAQSYISKNDNASTFSFQWQGNHFYRTAMVINLLSFATILFLFILHKAYWERKYQKTVSGILKRNPEIDPSQWQNKSCEDYFQNCERRHLLKGVQDDREKGEQGRSQQERGELRE